MRVQAAASELADTYIATGNEDCKERQAKF